jgi:trimeric autotransporter adhesin
MYAVAVAQPHSQHPWRDALCRIGANLILLCLLLSAPAWAGSFQVTDFNTDLDDKTPGDGICADINGICSLRAAIEEGNALAGATRASPHTITFAVPQVNVINGDLPTLAAPFLITGPVVINGQGNASKHGCLSLSDAGTPALGYSNGATGSTLTLLSIGNCSGDGIVANGHGYHILGNFIGVDATMNAMPNNGNGMSLSASHTYGNFVDAAALDTLFQSFPPLPIQGSDVNTFAQNLATVLVTLDPDTINGNVVSGNAGDGVYIFSENLGAVFIAGNMIGTDITGNLAIANGGAGVHLNGDTFGNMIGPGNTISANTGNGIQIDDPTVYLPNFVMANRIGLPTATVGAHIGNGLSGIFTDTKPDGSITNKNPTGMSLVIGPGNFISDNQGAPNSTDPDLLPTGGAGIYITGASNGVTVIGNTIGMAEIPAGSPQQSTAYGNAGDGVIVTATGNTVGGSTGNVIAGNKRHGIVVSTSADTSTHVLGNTIGLYPSFAGDLTLGNGFDGIHIDAASSTYVGGPNAGDANIIAGNGRNGVKILDGGIANGWSNLVQRNQIFANAQGNASATPALPQGSGVGIDLDHVPNAADGPHQEFPGSYANLDQAPPVICTGAGGEPAECSGFTPAASGNGMTTFDWTIATHGPAIFRMEFFQINAADDNLATSMTFLAEQQVTTDVTGLPTGCTNGRCTTVLPVNTTGSYVLMTTTDITPLTDQPGNLGDWKNNLTCFIGDLGLILSACTVNDSSEFSNVVAMPLSNNANLNNLAISAGSLMPSFASATLDYTDAVTSATSSVTVTPTTADANATVTVNGTAVASGAASAPITLNAPGTATQIQVAVTAQDGTTMQTYTITVNRAGNLSNNAALANLTISGGSFVPSFASATLNYTDAVSNATSSVTVTPTTSDPNATVTVNGTAVASGAASGSLALGAPGSSTPISVIVTAQDGTTTQTYTIDVNRAGSQSNDATLGNLTISAGSLMPSFASATLAYTDAVSNATSSVTVTPTTADANATVTVNGTTVANGAASGAIALGLPGSSTPIMIVVTAQDTTTTQTYTITVNRAGSFSNNAALSSLAISAGSLVPSFASATLSYTDAVVNATSSVTVTPTTADANATLTVNGTAVASGSASGAIALGAPGSSTPITIIVTAQDGTTTQTYTISVNRAGNLSNNAALSNLAISSGSLVPSFASATLNYTDAVSNATASVTVTPTTADPNATVTVNGTAVASASASGAIALGAPGSSTPVTVVVTAQDGTTTQTYTISVDRAGNLSNNAALSNLTISAGSLVPAFASATLGYTDAESSATASVTLTPTTADPTATVTVNGNAVASGSASAPINLGAPGSSTPVTLIVTAQDMVTTETYTIAVGRAANVVTTFSGTTFTNTGTATATLSGGGATCSFGTASLVGPPASPPGGVNFPDGLFQFTTTGCTGAITVQVTFPTAFTGTEKYWKYGPTPGPTAAHWYTLGAANNVSLSGHTATFTIADGGLGDDDLSVNGSIVDAGGPGVVGNGGQGPGGNGVAMTPSLTTWGLMLLSGLLILFGAVRVRTRR